MKDTNYYYQASKAVHPNERQSNAPGISYREWLIGQALATVSDSNTLEILGCLDIDEEDSVDQFNTIVARSAIGIADKIIELLANE